MVGSTGGASSMRFILVVASVLEIGRGSASIKMRGNLNGAGKWGDLSRIDPLDIDPLTQLDDRTLNPK